MRVGSVVAVSATAYARYKIRIFFELVITLPSKLVYALWSALCTHDTHPYVHTPITQMTLLASSPQYINQIDWPGREHPPDPVAPS